MRSGMGTGRTSGQIMRTSRPIRARLGATCAGALLLAGCGMSRAPAEEAVRLAAGDTWVYDCGGGYGFVVHVLADSVRLTRDEGAVTLPRVEAAPGARYSAGGVTFSSRGVEASLEQGGRSWRNCRGQRAETVWAVSRLLGNEFRAVGQEPGWMVEIDPGRRMHVLLDYGEIDLFTSRPERVAGPGDSTVYQARTGRGEVVVTILARPCADVMSGEAFPATVRLSFEGRIYDGCGRPLDGQAESVLTASRWTLMEIDGEPAGYDGGSPPELQLTEAESRLSGSTGCNGISGRWVREGDGLRFPEPIATTRRACADPRGNRLEQSFLAVLARTDRFSIEDGVLTLFGGAEVLARFSRP
jgi:heat shock protein HslJ/membrane-bound inhibitor of C-type lysozyme